AHQRDRRRDPHRRQQAPDRTLHRKAEAVPPAELHRPPGYVSFDEISRTASPTVLTASTSSSAISMPNSSSNASTTSTRRAEFTLRSSRMCVIGPTRASASLFFAYGVRIPTTLFITSVSLTLPLLPSGGPLPEHHAGVDVAEAEACLGQYAQLGHRPQPVRNRSRERRDLGVQVLAVDRRMQESALHHDDARHALDPARGAQRVTDERLRRGDRRERRRRPLERRGPRLHLARVGAGGGEVAVDRVNLPRPVA